MSKTPIIFFTKIIIKVQKSTKWSENEIITFKKFSFQRCASKAKKSQESPQLTPSDLQCKNNKKL